MAIKNQTLVFLFFILLFVIVSQGIICQPIIGKWPIDIDGIRYFKIFVTSTFHFTPLAFCEEKLFFKNFWLENGFVENLQAILLFLSIILIVKYKKFHKKNFLVRIFLTLNLIGLIYYLGEEISWGQHIFKWESLEFLKIITIKMKRIFTIFQIYLINYLGH